MSTARGTARRVSQRLPEFPWDTIAAARAAAAAHPGGIIDLSVGTPVDAVSPLIRESLSAAAAAPGYPTTAGTQVLRRAIAAAVTRRYGIAELDPDTQVLPVTGTKELIAGLPGLLGLGAGDTVVIPETAYPTYEVGALLAGTEVVRADGTAQVGPLAPALAYINSPSNPTGKVLPPEHLQKMVAWAQERGTVLASDECYLGLGWEATPRSILDPQVSSGQLTGLLAIHSLSKSSNLAGYRAGFVLGDPELIAELLAVRKHAGLMVPGPIQAAMVAALTDDGHVERQRARYAQRREILREAVIGAGLRIEHSEAGLYLWATRGEDSRSTHRWLAELGILTAPGEFYGPAGGQHVRIALTASDERIAAAADRLRAVS